MQLLFLFCHRDSYGMIIITIKPPNKKLAEGACGTPLKSLSHPLSVSFLSPSISFYLLPTLSLLTAYIKASWRD